MRCSHTLLITAIALAGFVLANPSRARETPAESKEEKEDARKADPALFPPSSRPLGSQRPQDRPLLMPGEPGYLDDPFELPPSSVLDLPTVPAIRGTLLIRVTRFDFEGNTVFSDEQLRGVLQPFLDKETLSSEELEAARLALTRFYVDGGEIPSDASDGVSGQGYVNSGAVLPDQDPIDGVIVFKIIEGTLTDIKINWSRTAAGGEREKTRRLLRDRFLEPRMRRGVETPLHLGRLREQLQFIQRNPNIKRINAELKPGAVPGESYLEAQIEKGTALTFGIDALNDRPPSVGGEQIELWATHTSLTGHSDILQFRYGLLDSGFEKLQASAFDNFYVLYSLPVNRWDTTLDASWEKQSFAIIGEPFDVLDIEGESTSLRFGVRQPISRSERNEIWVGLHLDVRHSETTLFDIPFSITPGAVNGEIDVTALRFSQEWVNRSRDRVFAARSTLSFGLNAFDATGNGTDRDGSFISWLGQAQYVRRIELENLFGNEEIDYDFQVILRGLVELSPDPLLAPEQLTVGGIDSVRGYRENFLVRDQGYFASLEFRLPLLSNRSGDAMLTLAPFIDFGGGWNSTSGGGDRLSRNISSIGTGLLFKPFRRLDAAVYWGHAFQDTNFMDDNLQDEGIHFRVSLSGR